MKASILLGTQSFCEILVSTKKSLGRGVLDELWLKIGEEIVAQGRLGNRVIDLLSNQQVLTRKPQ